MKSQPIRTSLRLGALLCFAALLSACAAPNAPAGNSPAAHGSGAAAWQNLALQPSGGSVGIGLTSPGATLDIGSTPSAGTTVAAQFAPDTTNWGMKLNQRYATSPNAIDYDWVIRNSSSTDINALTIISSGYVGIG